MAQVKIKSSNNNEQRKLELLERLAKKDICITKLILTNDGFVVRVFTSSDADFDIIFNNDTDKTLKEKNFVSQIPPQLKANRAVTVLRVDGHINKNDEESVKEEINEKNDCVTDIIQVQKFPSGSIYDLHQAKKAQEAGLKLFSEHHQSQHKTR